MDLRCLLSLPRCRDCFDLSRAAVDKRVDSVFTRDVFPESTCPRIPTLTLITSSGFGGFLSLLEAAGAAAAAVALVEEFSSFFVPFSEFVTILFWRRPAFRFEYYTMIVMIDTTIERISTK